MYVFEIRAETIVGPVLPAKEEIREKSVVHSLSLSLSFSLSHTHTHPQIETLTTSAYLISAIQTWRVQVRMHELCNQPGCFRHVRAAEGGLCFCVLGSRRDRRFDHHLSGCG
ncbi:hypothetical protein CHARACLAT_003635 [Characodon lateralis]|uniref:Uncharacterized protein n=1 Tax=Characodon lateralis TaxID=208331 RepID=A0ABU7E6S0_9TELE|nr:hypothetical protein [Characodon lateralis]